MSNHTLHLSVVGDQLICSESRITADSIEYITAAFTFDSSWDGLYKTAVFRVGELVYHTPLEADACTIPYEALTEGILAVSVFGVLGTTRATTTEALLTVEASGYVPCEPNAPSPDPYAYYLEQVTGLRQEAAEDAAASETSAQAAESALARVLTAQEAVISAAAETAEQKQVAAEAAEEATYAMHSAIQCAAQSEQHANAAAGSAAAAKTAEAEAGRVVLNSIEEHNAAQNELAHPNLYAIASEAKSIALGKANSLCFATQAELQAWLDGSFVRTDGRTPSDLKIGDNLYILELDVPDYWWDGTTAQPLGAERPDLTDYYSKADIDARIGNANFSVMTRADYDAAYAAGGLEAGRIYFVVEEATV